jgi:hypothetical protein
MEIILTDLSVLADRLAGNARHNYKGDVGFQRPLMKLKYR